MENNVFFLIANLIILGVTAWFSYRRTKFENIVDDSTAATNYRKLVIDLQTDVREARQENKEIKDMLANSHLDIGMRIQVGEKPEIISWNWKTVVEPITQKPPSN